MNHDFDIERAKAGEPIQFCQTGGVWKDVRYVGQSQLGIVIEELSGGNFTCTGNTALRMKPMPTKKWVLEFDSLEDAQDAEHALGRGDGSRLWPDIREVEIPPTE